MMVFWIVKSAWDFYMRDDKDTVYYSDRNERLF